MGGLCGSSREQPRAEDVGEGGAGSPQISVLVRLCYINVLRKNWSLNILCRKQIGRSTQFFAVADWGEMSGFPTRERAAVCCFGKPARTVYRWCADLSKKRSKRVGCSVVVFPGLPGIE